MSDEAVENDIPRASEAEALASLREFAIGPISAVFTWSEAGTILELIETLTKSGIIEVAVRNPSVAEYMAHWESRAVNAETDNAALSARIEGLEKAGDHLRQCANAIVGASTDDPDAAEAFDMFNDARDNWRRAKSNPIPAEPR